MAIGEEVLRRNKIYVGGKWLPSDGSDLIDVVDPATEAVIGSVPNGTADDVDQAARAAREAFDSWSQTSPGQRGELIARITDALTARADEFATLIAHEVGMPLKQSRTIQVGLAISDFRAASEAISAITWEETVGNSLVLREPIGVVGAITPWNYPLHQVAAKVAGALAAGCTIVVKPSEVAPLSAFMLADLIDELGLPPGVFNLVSGTGHLVGEALVVHPDIDMVSFTGSTRAGRRISELAAASVKPVALELGGKSAAIVLDDADLQSSIEGTLTKCYQNSGQTCSALARMLVPREQLARAEEVAAAVAAGYRPGHPFAEDSKIGPLVSEQQVNRVRHYIQTGVDGGAKLVTGGAERPSGLEQGYFVAPTVFSNVRSDMVIAQEEIFGPVLVIIPYDDEDDAIRIANDTEYGLAGAVWSSNEARAAQVARRMRTGQISINGGPFNPAAPFGGFKQSGHGRELGRFGIEEFLTYKSLQT